MTNRENSSAVLWVSLAVTGIFIVFGVFFNERLAAISSSLLQFTLDAFGWFYLLAALGFLLFSAFLLFTRYGRIRLGEDTDKPEYSTLSWIAMLYSAGMGVGLVFWGVAEPLSHYVNPPYGAGRTAEAAETALTYTFFHWGLHPWAIYTVVGLSLAYFQFRRKLPALISSAFHPLLGHNFNGPIGKTVDVLAVFATVFGVATSLGLGTLQIAGGMERLVGISNSTALQIAIIVILTAMYITSASTGLSRGIKILSNVNIALAVGMMALVIVAGPTAHILKVLVTTTGNYLDRLFAMSLRLEPFRNESWIASWTLFYWAWWIAWAPFVGSFIARISRGRTIREFVLGVLVVPTLGTFVWFSAFGGTSLHIVHTLGDISLAEQAVKDVTSALFAFLAQIPFTHVLIPLAIVLIITFFVTSADSATYVLGMFTTGGNLHPTGSIKVLWGLIQSATAVVLLLSGSLTTLQTVSIVAAFPFSVVMVAMCYALNKALHQEEISEAAHTDTDVAASVSDSRKSIS